MNGQHIEVQHRFFLRVKQLQFALLSDSRQVLRGFHDCLDCKVGVGQIMQLDRQEGFLSLDDFMGLIKGNANLLVDGVDLDLLIQETIFNRTFISHSSPLDNQSCQE